MKRDRLDHALLRVYAQESFIPVVTAFTESMADALGLGKSETLSLMLAAEEVFNHLCRVVLPEGEWVEVRCSGGGYYVQADFTFPVADFDLRAFNMTASVSLADDAAIEQMGLFLASRSVDRFRMVREEGQRLRLTLIKEKVYPVPEACPAPAAEARGPFTVRPPDAEEIKHLARLVRACYPGQMLPNLFSSPGRLVDMAGGGEVQAAVAVGPSGAIGGGALWCWAGARSVEWFGPYVFHQPSDSPLPAALLEHCIGAIARTPAIILLNRFPTPEFPREQFEYLGSLDSTRDRDHREAWARLMQEDLGSVAWCHPQLQPFLTREAERLVLPRDIRLVTHQGERRSPHSALLTAFDRQQESATLEPVWFGEDFERNLLQHLELFRREGIASVLFPLDLGQSWQADFTPGLLKNGFEPRLLLPYAGTGDLVLFEHRGAHA